jgi:hypothetical protein
VKIAQAKAFARVRIAHVMAGSVRVRIDQARVSVPVRIAHAVMPRHAVRAFAHVTRSHERNDQVAMHQLAA